jgi:GDSL-like Lipase/Acylhydrolase family
VGGNDAGFADVLTECATPWWAGDCDGAIDQAQAFINNTLPGRLSTLYASIRTRAPNAKVVVVGYPRIFMGEDCNAGTWFSPAEMTRLNQTADLLNGKTSSQASARGFSFANPTSRFIGHAVCDDPEWINGLSNPISESYHPNKPGHSSGYTPTVSPLLTGAAVTVNGKIRAASNAMADELAAQQRRYADVDAATRPESFRAPTIDSLRAPAERAGIDLDRWLARH